MRVDSLRKGGPPADYIASLSNRKVMAFNTSGEVKWTKYAPTGAQPLYALADGSTVYREGTYGNAAKQLVTLGVDGNEVLRIADPGAVYSWIGNTYRPGSTESIAASQPTVNDTGFASRAGGNRSGTGTSSQECAPLDTTIGAKLETAFSSLTNLLLYSTCDFCILNIFEPLGTSQAEFTSYLQQGHEFCDGMNSRTAPGGLIDSPYGSVAEYFQVSSRAPDFVAAATARRGVKKFGIFKLSSSERYPLRIYFAPQNLTSLSPSQTEALDFHEALHGFSGLSDGGAPPLTSVGLCDVLGATSSTKIKQIYTDCFPNTNRITEWLLDNVIVPK